MLRCGEIVGAVVNYGISGQRTDMVGKNTIKCMAIMIWEALAIDRSGRRI
jgi:hypothetical protein